MTAPVTDAADRPRTTIMVVDPDVVVRAAIAEYLRDCGYQVMETLSAEEALAVLEGGRSVDVVFSEVMLPEMNGFALSKTLRERYPGIGVILASSTNQAIDRAADLCDDGPIAKPYNPDEVLRRIQLMRENRRRSRDD